MNGPLTGISILEMAGLGPAPCAATLLADAGATVIRIEGRQKSALHSPIEESKDPYLRGRKMHPHNLARKTFVDMNGTQVPGPVPRFSQAC